MIATEEKLNQSTGFIFAQNRHFEPAKLFHRRYWDADWFQSIVMHGIVYAKASEFVQSAK